MTSSRRRRAPVLSSVVVVTTATALLLTGCENGSKSVPGANGRTASAFDSPMSIQEKTRIATLSASVDAKIAGGYGYRVTGRARWITASADGKLVIHMGAPGNYLRLALVPKSEAGTRLNLESTARRPQAWTPDCGDDCSAGDDGPPSTPEPPPPPPPNFSACSSGGGATWYDISALHGGCLGAGSGTRLLTCGTWTFSSPGRGSFRAKVGGAETIASWVTDHGDGLCDLG